MTTLDALLILLVAIALGALIISGDEQPVSCEHAGCVK